MYHNDIIGCFFWDLLDRSWIRALRRLGDVPKRRWVFHLRHTCVVSGTYRETSLRRHHDVLLLDGFVIHIKTEGFYEDIAHHVEKLFDTSMIRMIKIPLPTDKNKKLMGLFKDELGGNIMKEFVGLTYLMDDDTEYKKQKKQKSV